jgi:hypothetical protein
VKVVDDIKLQSWRWGWLGGQSKSACFMSGAANPESASVNTGALVLRFVLFPLFWLLCFGCCIVGAVLVLFLVLFPLVWHYLYVSHGTSCTLFLINLCLIQKN